MIIVSITGGPASGKTTLLNTFKKQGYSVYSADQFVSDIYNTDNRTNKKIRALFKVNQEIPNNLLKKVVSDLVTNKSQLRELQSIIYPKFEIDIFLFLLKQYVRNPRQIVFLEIPMLFEAGYQNNCDYIITTVCDLATQKQRYMERPFASSEKFDIMVSNRANPGHNTNFTFKSDSADTNNQVKEILHFLNGKKSFRISKVLSWVVNIILRIMK